jgi:hypothetical protein
MRHIELDRRRDAIMIRETNTYIGGISSSVNSASALASKLRYYPNGSTLSTSAIRDFKIVGSDIEATIDVDYEMYNFTFNGDSNLTYYKDTGGKCKVLQKASFSQVPNCRLLYFPNVIRIDPTPTNWSFQGPAIKRMYFPKCVKWGANHQQEAAMFRNNYSGTFKVYAEPTMATINAGGEEGDLAYAKNTLSGTVNYVQNYTVPSQITDLAHNASILTFSTPSSSNTIDFYEVFVNGKYKQDISGSGSSVSGLVAGDKVVVYACDIYYNRSISNEITI